MKVKLYKTYLFRDKDPVIDGLRTLKQKAKKSNKAIAEESNISATTLSNWFDGETKRPQFATVVAAARVFGRDGEAMLLRIVRSGGRKK